MPPTDFFGSVLAGCAAGKLGGGSCSQGAINAVGSMAINYLVQSAAANLRPSQSSMEILTASEPSLPKPREELVAINWDLKIFKKAYDYVKDGFEVPDNYKEGVIRGESDRQTKIDAIKEINRRIEENPDSAATQKSAKPYKEFSVDMAGPASKLAESLPDSKKPLVIIPSGAGYIKGYFDCKVCK